MPPPAMPPTVAKPPVTTIPIRLADTSEVNRAKKKPSARIKLKTDEPAEVVVVLISNEKLKEYTEWFSNGPPGTR